jgi:hypothetical protein
MLAARVLPAATMAGPDVDFDISKTAGSYSQMASVFTGFAFLAMTIVLSRRDYNPRTKFTPRQLDQGRVVRQMSRTDRQLGGGCGASPMTSAKPAESSAIIRSIS